VKGERFSETRCILL